MHGQDSFYNVAIARWNWDACHPESTSKIMKAGRSDATRNAPIALPESQRNSTESRRPSLISRVLGGKKSGEESRRTSTSSDKVAAALEARKTAGREGNWRFSHFRA